jgi:hypothetical protein
MRSSFLFIMVSVVVIASLAFGQVGNGTITGTITDPTGAVVPGAAVDARNAQTGVHFAGASTAAGTFTIADLPVGTYAVTVVVAGFKTYNHSNLAVAASSESVTVTAEGSLLTTESGELATNITINQLDQLPLLGIGSVNAGTSGYRNPYNTLLTLPGVSSYASSGQFNINGLTVRLARVLGPFRRFNLAHPKLLILR